MSETFTDYLDQSNQDQVPADNPTPSTDYTQGEQKGVNLIADAPDVRVEKLLTEARAANNAKQRYKDSQSYGIIEDDYVASQKHLEDLQNKIDQTQKMLDGSPPPRPAAGDLNTGEQLAAAIALLASHGNPFATQQIMGASQKNADQRADQTNAYNQAVYEHHRATLLGQLQDMLAQHKAETQHGYSLQELQAQTQSAVESQDRLFHQQQALQNMKNDSKRVQDAKKILADPKSTVVARQGAIADLEAEGHLISPDLRQQYEQSTYYEANKTAQTGKYNAETAFIQGPKTDIYKAHASYYGDLGRNINSEIESRRLRDRLTQAETDEIRAKIINMPAELRMKAMHAQADMIRARNSGDQPGSVKATATWAHLLDAKVKLLDAKAAKVYKQGQDLVGEWKSEKAKTDYESVMKERDAAVEEMNASVRQVGEATKASGRPAGKTDQQLIDEANYAVKHGAPKAKIQSQLEAWGVHVGP